MHEEKNGAQRSRHVVQGTEALPSKESEMLRIARHVSICVSVVNLHTEYVGDCKNQCS
jgi:hypothetical protein